MPHLSRRSVLAATALALAGPAAAQTPPLTRAYGTDPRQQMDLYGPFADDGPAPILMFLPGGGWRTHARTDVWDMPRFARRQGLLFICADYRAMPGNGARAQAQDAAAAVAWIKANAAVHGGDADRVFVMGHSAGGHLAALINCDPTYLGAHGLSPADMAGVILLDGACYDATQQRRFLQAHSRTADYFEVLFEGRMEAFTPADLVTAGTPTAPMLMLFAASRPYAFDQNYGFARALRAADRPYRLVEDRQATHVSMAQAFGRHGDRMGQAAAEFIRTGRL
ncbi:alpha/beta hydrolase [Brevundimonas sp.]|uniref:alpha/beta hydrolase n=1 Tax=Brevundimonas sp. TaxID=1871086 RepID=UPI0025DC165C|nr:alpha/beta hydrolase [Brevundimonas sp.]